MTSLSLFLSCIGEGNGNPLQCSCPENPRDGEAWWAAVCGVAQSRTRLKRLSSSSLDTIQFQGRIVIIITPPVLMELTLTEPFTILGVWICLRIVADSVSGSDRGSL